MAKTKGFPEYGVLTSNGMGGYQVTNLSNDKVATNEAALNITGAFFVELKVKEPKKPKEKKKKDK